MSLNMKKEIRRELRELKSKTRLIAESRPRQYHREWSEKKKSAI